MPPLDPQAQQVLNQRNGGGQAPQQAQPRPQPLPQPQQRGPVFGPQVVPDQPTAREIAADERAAAADARAAASDGRAQATFEGTGGTATEGQAKISTMLTRILGGSRDIAGEVQNDANAQSPGFAEVATRGILGDGIVSRATSGETRRIVTDAQADMIDALLTLSTGAAYTPEQVVAQRLAHFPQLGDTPREIEIKNQRLARLMEAARVAAGPQWGEIEAAITPLMPTIMGQTQGRDGAGGTTGNPSAPPPSGPRGGGPQPTLQDYYPQGAEMGFDKQEGPFDRAGALLALGVRPEGETALVGNLNAISRSAQGREFTAQDAVALYGRLNLPPPDEAGIAQLVESVRAGNQFGGIDTSTMEADYQRGLDQYLEQGGNNPEGIGATIGALGAQGLTFGQSDELTGIGTGIAAAFRGENPITGYQIGRDADRRFIERSKQANPGTATVAEIGGALLTGGVRAAPAVMREVRPVAAAAREGAILGGVGGFGYGEGPADSLSGTVIGAGTGAIFGAGLTAGVQKIAPGVNRIAQVARGERVTPAADDVNAVMQAAERVNANRGDAAPVVVRRADVDPAVRNTRADLVQGDGGQPVRNMETEDLATMEQALARTIGREGATRDQVALGEAVQTGARGILRDVRNRATRFYNRARGQSEGVTVQPENMLRSIDENIAELTTNGANQNAAQIRYLQGVREDIAATGGLSIDALRAQRTQMRGNIDTAGLTMTDMERRMDNILRAASRDIQTGLASRPEALSAFKEGDRLWREQALFERQIARRIIGTDNTPVSPATAAQRVTTFFNNDPTRARAVWDQLSDDTRGNIQAQLTANLGRQANGNFSLSTFLTHTGGGKGALMPPRTMALIYGERGVEAIRDLRILAGAKVAATERNNTSNTGGIIKRAGRGLRTMILGAVGLSEAGVTGGAVAIGAANLMQRLGENRAVRLLTNPEFTKWMRRLPETDNPRAIDGAFGRLRRVASGNVQFQNDVQAFQQALIGAANDNSGMVAGVAAEPQDQQQP